MIQSIGLVEMEDQMKQVRGLFHKAGVPSR